MLYMENTEQPGTAGVKNGSEWSNGTVQNFNRTDPSKKSGLNRSIHFWTVTHVSYPDILVNGSHPLEGTKISS